MLSKDKKITLLIALCILLSLSLNLFRIELNKLEPQKKAWATLDCNSESVRETADCLTEFISYFYNYNLDNSEVPIKEMDLQRLVNEGGVCRHYNYFIEKWARERGFLTTHVTMPEIRHGFSVIYSNKTGEYCAVDQQIVVGCASPK